MFMLEVTLPGWDCLCKHAFLYLCLNELKCVNVIRLLVFFCSCRVEVQSIGLCMQVCVCESTQKEVLAQGLPLTFWP